MAWLGTCEEGAVEFIWTWFHDCVYSWRDMGGNTHQQSQNTLEHRQARFRIVISHILLSLQALRWGQFPLSSGFVPNCHRQAAVDTAAAWIPHALKYILVCKTNMTRRLARTAQQLSTAVSCFSAPRLAWPALQPQATLPQLSNTVCVHVTAVLDQYPD